MRVDLKPYPSCKPSGVEWLGDVPEHWEVRPGRAYYSSRQISNKALQETTVLSLSYGQIKVKTEDQLHGLVPASFETYQIVEPGDIICRPTDLQNDWNSLRFGLSRHRGIITSAYMCLHTRVELARDYGYLLLHAYDLKKVFYGLGSGLRQNLGWSDFKLLPCLAPPLPEQTAIVRYLDHVDERIRRYISGKQKLIRLLEEEKQAVINQAVTGQVDVCTGQPYKAYKPSGVGWLGDVPAHWEVSRVKTEFHSLNHRRVPLSAVERGAMRERQYDYYGASGVIDKVDDYLFDDELLLIAEDGANLVLRNLPLAITARGKFWVNNHAHILKPRRGNLEYLAIVMEGLNYTPWISGAAQPKLTQDRLMNISIAVPPRSEQDEIIAKATAQTSELSTVIDRTRRQIDLLQEYRTRLIADVVTGKLDVRGVAASLPNEHHETDLPDVESEMLSETTVKMNADGATHHVAARGNAPIDTLDTSWIALAGTLDYCITKYAPRLTFGGYMRVASC